MAAITQLAERVGQTLKGRYRIDQVLHVGARSTVYAGLDLKAGRVAIKVQASADDAHLLRSSYLANAVGHPSAVSVLDTGHTGDGAGFLVMELLEATSMCELMEQHGGLLPVRLACEIADQALDLLAVAHAQGIAHGELGLAKLYFTRTERLKVLGFGVQANGQAAADDVRALSHAVTRLLCGEAVAPLQMPPAGAGLHPRVPARIAAVFERGLAAAPPQPWESAHAMRAALQVACQVELGRPVDQTLQPLAAQPAQRRLTRPFGLAAATAALAIGMYLSQQLVDGGLTAAEQPEPSAELSSAAQPSRVEAADVTPNAVGALDDSASQAAQTRAGEEPAAQLATPGLDLPDLPGLPGPSGPSGSPDSPGSKGHPPRRPNRPELRLPIHRNTGITTNIAPASQLCAELSSVRRARQLNEHEAHLFAARCAAR